MRTIILLAVVLFITACAEVPGTNIQPTSSSLVDNGYLYEDIQIEGMVYRIYFHKRNLAYPEKGVAIGIINITKDKLSVESLKR